MDETTYIALAEERLPSLFRLACSLTGSRADAEDAVQQTLLKAWTHRDRAREGAEKAWLARILINTCHDLTRRRGRTVPVAEVPDRPASSADPGDRAALRDLIEGLPERWRLPFLLKYMEGMTEKEVAAALHLPLSTVKHRLMKARNTLQTAWNGEVE